MHWRQFDQNTKGAHSSTKGKRYTFPICKKEKKFFLYTLPICKIVKEKFSQLSYHLSRNLYSEGNELLLKQEFAKIFIFILIYIMLWIKGYKGKRLSNTENFCSLSLDFEFIYWWLAYILQFTTQLIGIIKLIWSYLFSRTWWQLPNKISF